MIDFGKVFSDSYNQLKKNKKLAVPIFLSLLIPIFVGLVFLMVSGLNPLIKDIGTASVEFNKERNEYLMNLQNINDTEYGLEFAGLISGFADRGDYFSQVIIYLEENGYDFKQHEHLLNAKNIALGIIFIFILIFSSIYFACMSYCFIASVLKKQKVNRELIFRKTNSFVMKYVILKVIMFIIIFIPLILIPIIFGFLSIFNEVLSVIVFIVLGILFVIYLVILVLRLFFAIPILFLNNKRAVESLKGSSILAKGQMIQVFIVFVIIGFIGWFINSVVVTPFFNTFINMIFEVSWLKLIVNFIIVCFFFILVSFVYTFQILFLFNSYLDFKRRYKNGSE